MIVNKYRITVKFFAVACIFLFSISFGKAISITDYGYVCADSAINWSTESDFTIECWVKPESTTKWFDLAPIFSDNKAELHMKLKNSEIKMTGWTEGGGLDKYGNIDGSTVFEAGTWYHVAMVGTHSYGGRATALVFYVNGSESKAAQNTNTLSGTGLRPWIGSDPDADTRQFFGVIDEVRVWKVARTEAEISANMNKELDLAETLSGDLVLYYKFNEVQYGNRIADYSSNQRHGTLVVGFGGKDSIKLVDGYPGLEVTSIPPIDPGPGVVDTTPGISNGIVSLVSSSVISNFPNPLVIDAGSNVNISYSIGDAGNVSISVFNTFGKNVKEIVRKHANSGTFAVTWDGKNSNGQMVAPGNYFYSIKSNGKVIGSKKIVIAK